MASILERIENATFSRRKFLAGSIAATAALAGLSMGAYAEESSVALTNTVSRMPRAMRLRRLLS